MTYYIILYYHYLRYIDSKTFYIPLWLWHFLTNVWINITIPWPAFTLSTQESWNVNLWFIFLSLGFWIIVGFMVYPTVFCKKWYTNARVCLSVVATVPQMSWSSWSMWLIRWASWCCWTWFTVTPPRTQRTAWTFLMGPTPVSSILHPEGSTKSGTAASLTIPGIWVLDK